MLKFYYYSNVVTVYSLKLLLMPKKLNKDGTHKLRILYVCYFDFRLGY